MLCDNSWFENGYIGTYVFNEIYSIISFPVLSVFAVNFHDT